MNRSPNTSLGTGEERRLRPGARVTRREALQVSCDWWRASYSSLIGGEHDTHLWLVESHHTHL